MGFFDNFRRPKERFSIANLKYLHDWLVKHTPPTEQFRDEFIEILRQISEIIIWGDQHDPKFFDFFLEKNMLSFFMDLFHQPNNQVQIQLLQTISILIENMRNQHSIYYLLSNNYINDLIVFKFDFSDDEILAYYISFLKTLSLKLTPETVQFFFNEQKKDFPLYTEAIKFFNHPEQMTRIAVRTLTLNVFKVEEPRMREYILTSTAVPYFANIAWFIRRQCHTLHEKAIVASYADVPRLEARLEELLDFFFYLHDIFCLGISQLSAVLAEELLKYFLLPLLVGSLKDNPDPLQNDELEDRIAPSTALFLLAHVFFIFKEPVLVNTLAAALLHPNPLSFVRLPPAYVTNQPPPLTVTRQRHHRRSSSTGSVPKEYAGGNQYRAELLRRVDAEDSILQNLLTFLYALVTNDGIRRELLEAAALVPGRPAGPDRTKSPNSKEPRSPERNKSPESVAQSPDRNKSPESFLAKSPERVLAERSRTPEGEYSSGLDLGEGSLPVTPEKENNQRERDEGTPEKERDEASESEDSAGKSQERRLHSRSRSEGHALRQPSPSKPRKAEEKPSFPPKKTEYDLFVDSLFRVLHRGAELRVLTCHVAWLLLMEVVVAPAPPRTGADMQEIYEAAVLRVRDAAGEVGTAAFLTLWEAQLADSRPFNLERHLGDASLLLPVSQSATSKLSLRQRLPGTPLERAAQAVLLWAVCREGARAAAPLPRPAKPPYAVKQVFAEEAGDLVLPAYAHGGNRCWIVLRGAYFLLVGLKKVPGQEPAQTIHALAPVYQLLVQGETRAGLTEDPDLQQIQAQAQQSQQARGQAQGQQGQQAPQLYSALVVSPRDRTWKVRFTFDSHEELAAALLQLSQYTSQVLDRKMADIEQLLEPT